MSAGAGFGRYRPPVADQRFVLEHVLQVEREMAGYGDEGADLDLALIDEMLAQAGRFAAEVVMPLNAKADRSGCTFEAGQVRTPEGFPAAFRQWCELGWNALSFDEAWGGQGVPRVVFACVQEMMSSAGLAFQMFASINQCAHDCLSRAANDSLRAEWLPKLADGSAVATMCLSEPQAGSDLGLLTTRATPQPDGTYRVSGTKIFASGAEHDLSENILHLVLARIAGAPAGTRGISLFVVPKFLDGHSPDGRSGHRVNAVRCLGIEHKLGIHGSPTCVMNFEDAEAWIVGEPDRGLAAMFHMMNAARLSTGVQAVGIGEAAYQQALAYATDRRQGRVPGRSAPGGAPDPIIGHADVQRMLGLQRAYNEGGRAVACWTALLIDRSVRDRDPTRRAEATDAIALLTPVVKGFLSENAQLCTSLALQIHGGHGYIAETGIEQYSRDVRITTIYEGTTGIQATDLLVRKILQSPPRSIETFVSALDASVIETSRAPASQAADTPGAEPGRFARAQERTMSRLLAVTRLIRERAGNDHELPYRIATSYLRLFGHAVMSTLWLRMAIAAEHLPEPARAEKLRTASFYFGQLLPEVETVIAVIEGSVDEVL